MRVILAVDNRVVDLLAEDYDIGIGIGPLPDSELVARRLSAFASWPCASPAYLAQHSPILKPEDISSHRVLMHGDLVKSWRFRSRDGTVVEVAVQQGSVVPEPDVVRTLLIAGAGIGVLPNHHAAAAIAEGTLVRVLPNYDLGAVDMHALYPSLRSLSAKVRVFIDALIKHLNPTKSA